MNFARERIMTEIDLIKPVDCAIFLNAFTKIGWFKDYRLLEALET
jgi:hypothetical protein